MIRLPVVDPSGNFKYDVHEFPLTEEVSEVI